MDLSDLMQVLFTLAYKTRVNTLELRTGRGTLSVESPLSIRDSVAIRMRNYTCICAIQTPANQAVIYCQLDRLELRKLRSGPMSEDLKKLYNQLKREEKLQEVPQFTKTSAQAPTVNQDLTQLTELLTHSWNEDMVKSEILKAQSERNQKKLDAIMDLIAPYEIFYSDSFRKLYLKLSDSVDI